MTSPPHRHRRRRARPRASLGVRRVAAASLAFAVLTAACGGSGGDSATADEPTGSTLPAEPQTIVDAAAVAMGDVESVAFDVRASGAPVFIDQFESIAVTRLVGEFELEGPTAAPDSPGGAQAVLDVTVNGSLNTQLAAIAVGEEVWLSNPVTGDFETLPAGFDLDPSRFFDPQNGWRPLLANLTDVRFIERTERDGNDRYHLTGVAPAEQVRIITAGLVRGTDVEVDLWVQPVTGLVHSLEFSTATGTDTATDWVVELSGYGAEYDITPPPAS